MNGFLADLGAALVNEGFFWIYLDRQASRARVLAMLRRHDGASGPRAAALGADELLRPKRLILDIDLIGEDCVGAIEFNDGIGAVVGHRVHTSVGGRSSWKDRICRSDRSVAARYLAMSLRSHTGCPARLARRRPAGDGALSWY
jgi:hypothetical protein